MDSFIFKRKRVQILQICSLSALYPGSVRLSRWSTSCRWAIGIFSADCAGLRWAALGQVRAVWTVLWMCSNDRDQESQACWRGPSLVSSALRITFCAQAISAQFAFEDFVKYAFSRNWFSFSSDLEEWTDLEFKTRSDQLAWSLKIKSARRRWRTAWTSSSRERSSLAARATQMSKRLLKRTRGRSEREEVRVGEKKELKRCGFERHLVSHPVVQSW